MRGTMARIRRWVRVKRGEGVEVTGLIVASLPHLKIEMGGTQHRPFGATPLGAHFPGLRCACPGLTFFGPSGTDAPRHSFLIPEFLMPEFLILSSWSLIPVPCC